MTISAYRKDNAGGLTQTEKNDHLKVETEILHPSLTCNFQWLRMIIYTSESYCTETIFCSNKKPQHFISTTTLNYTVCFTLIRRSLITLSVRGVYLQMIMQIREHYYT